MLECMPKLVSATDRCGSIAAAAAANTGLAEGTPVYAGLFDIDACALATGVLSDDIFSITAGTWNINVFPSKTMAPLDGGCMNSVFPTGGTLVEASSPTSAGNLDYVLRMMTADAPKPPATTNSERCWNVPTPSTPTCCSSRSSTAAT